MSRRVFLVGGRLTPFRGKGHPDFITDKHPDRGKRQNPTLKELIVSSVQGALKDTNTDPNTVDRLWMGNFAGELFCSQGHLGASFAGAVPQFFAKPAMRVEGACASGGLAFASAVDSIRSGLSDVAIASGAEVQTTVPARTGGDYLARAADYDRERSLDDFTFPCLFARRVKAYLEKYPHNSLKDISHVTAKAYSNASKNALAHMHKNKMTLEAANDAPFFLNNEQYKQFLRLSDCSQVSDGAATVVIASMEGLQKLGKRPEDCVEVVGAEYGAGNLYEDPSDLTVLETTKAIADRLYGKIGWKPSDVQVAEVHDCFAVAEILHSEAVGLAEPGKGAELAKSGASHLDGRVPINTGGGLLAFGHPVGATGVKQILEIFKQMKGQAGEYQMKKIPSKGLTVNMGGDDKTVVIVALKNT